MNNIHKKVAFIVPDAIRFRAFDKANNKFILINSIDFCTCKALGRFPGKKITYINNKIGDCEWDRFTAMYDCRMVPLYERDIISDGISCWAILWFEDGFRVSTGERLKEFLSSGRYFRAGDLHSTPDLKIKSTPDNMWHK